uniref:Lysophosphatidylcholine acyltransferase n=1 Tax=Cacopsylla melanoneura TaxID=428564 RepID=A0A8D9BGW5_9HEMI
MAPTSRVVSTPAPQPATSEHCMVNPFVHHLELTSTYDKIITGIFTVVILPVRLVLIVSLLVVAWCLACVGLIGLSDEQLRKIPITGWRKGVKHVCRIILRAVFAVMGFHWVKVKGRQASCKEAPVISVAPHSSFSDALPVLCMGAPSVVARGETATVPFIKQLINYTQPVYVWRDDPNSRQKTIQEIIDRAKSEQDWPQVLIFPEGTCTNRSCLITFKPGAFYPGVPIQPVLLRYPNKLDTVTWTWDGPGAWKLLWLTLTQPHSNCEIEFMPVYTPSEAEIKDPKLYANNVRALMASALGVPTSDYSYEDCQLVTRARQLNLPTSSLLMQTQRLRSRLGLERKHVEEKLVEENPHLLTCPDSATVTLEGFASYLGVSSSDHTLQELFKINVKEEVGLDVIDFREYLLGVMLVSRSSNKTEMTKLAFQLCGNAEGQLDKSEFCHVMDLTLSLPPSQTVPMFIDIQTYSTGSVSYNDFERYLKNHPQIMNTNNNLTQPEWRPEKPTSHRMTLGRAVTRPRTITRAVIKTEQKY